MLDYTYDIYEAYLDGRVNKHTNIVAFVRGIQDNTIKLESKKQQKFKFIVNNTDDSEEESKDGVSQETLSSQEDKYVTIESPMVGTFYAAPSEDGDPFVKVGDEIAKGQPVCIVEAMKLMNEIEAETDGTVAEILVTNGQMVEFGQPLMKILPKA